MAQALNELEDSRRAFVANVSHELRSPLTSMRGYVQGMLDGAVPPQDTSRYLNVVMAETNRLASLVNDLLDLSRIESGKFPMEKRPYDVCEQLRRIVIGFEGRIDARHADVDMQLPDKPLPVNADQNRINQVISNLVDNAVKFLPESGGLLRLEALRQGEKVLIRVGDNGAAIPEKDLPRVFDRFYKADKAHTSGQGTGLGLAIVKSILDQHGEKITVRSDASGTIFEFTLEAAGEMAGPQGGEHGKTGEISTFVPGNAGYLSGHRGRLLRLLWTEVGRVSFLHRFAQRGHTAPVGARCFGY